MMTANLDSTLDIRPFEFVTCTSLKVYESVFLIFVPVYFVCADEFLAAAKHFKSKLLDFGDYKYGSAVVEEV